MPDKETTMSDLFPTPMLRVHGVIDGTLLDLARYIQHVQTRFPDTDGRAWNRLEGILRLSHKISDLLRGAREASDGNHTPTEAFLASQCMDELFEAWCLLCKEERGVDRDFVEGSAVVFQAMMRAIWHIPLRRW